MKSFLGSGFLAAVGLLFASVVIADSELRVASSGRYLVSSDGTPVYLSADTAWAITADLAAQMTRSQISEYLDQRRSQGFNAIMFVGYPYQHHNGVYAVNVNGHQAADQDGNMILNPGGSPDYPNDYWDHVDFVIRELERRSMYALLVPVWWAAWVEV